jgi:hypothetical protein
MQDGGGGAQPRRRGWFGLDAVELATGLGSSWGGVKTHEAGTVRLPRSVAEELTCGTRRPARQVHFSEAIEACRRRGSNPHDPHFMRTGLTLPRWLNPAADQRERPYSGMSVIARRFAV